MTSHSKKIVSADLQDPNRGRFDPKRAGRCNPADREPKPVVTPEDAAATRVELDELKHRMTRKTA